LQVHRLESRETPARFGTPWPDGENLTLGLAPNGTPIAGRTSDLDTLLSTLGPSGRFDVLRAFQTWTVRANLNLGLVADDGSAFGTAGPPQGDSRFGDIRVGGVALPSDVLAVTAPFNYYDNYSGDVVVNTAARFGPGGADPYTVLLQEAGHALGIGNSADPASVMYEYYRGTRTALSAGDVAAVQQLYGPRTPDRYEGSTGNDTRGTATGYTQPVTADLTTAADADVYRFTGGLLTSRVTVSLRAEGLSMLTARVEILDANGTVLRSAAVTDPTANDLTLSLDQVRFGATYYVRVSAARADVFGVGSYQLSVAQQSLLGTVTGLLGGLVDTVNNTLFTATSLLTNVLVVGPQTEYAGGEAFNSSSDVDYYRITVPPSANGQPVNLVTMAWGQNGAALNPWVEVQDGLGRKLAGEVLTADGVTTTVQVRGLVPGGTYFLRFASDTRAVGAYRFSADLRADALWAPKSGSGGLSAAHPSASGTFYLAQSGQVHFLLAADGASGSAAELVVTGKDGKVVARITAAAGRGRSADVFLPAGSYRVTVRSAGTVADVAYTIGLAVITDPVGPTSADPANNPDPPPSSPPPSDPPPTGEAPPDDGGSWWWTSDYTSDGAQWY
jgi:hypothetical protein